MTHYLVKWCSLPYEESTWELEEDVDPAKVKEFESLQVLPEIKHVVTYPRHYLVSLVMPRSGVSPRRFS